MLINLKDRRLKCLLYDIPRQKFIPTRCSYRATVLCVYDIAATGASSATTTAANLGPCAGVGPLGKLQFTFTVTNFKILPAS